MLPARTSEALAPQEAPAPLGDPRFRALLTAVQWSALPLPVRRRFSKRFAGGDTVVYRGTIVGAEMSRAGSWLAQLGRIIGAPLPLSRDVDVPAVVTVTEDVAAQGQHWTRLYARRSDFPQVVHSSKRFAGPTGLEEYVGAGVGMALTVAVESETLIFRSAWYFLQLFGHRLRLPRWLSPGQLTVTHGELGQGRFEFTLDLTHPWFGTLLRQTAVFEETYPT